MKTMQPTESPEPNKLNQQDQDNLDASVSDTPTHQSSQYQNGIYEDGLSASNILPDDASQMLDLMLTLERPTSESLNGMNRGEKHKTLTKNSEQLRTELLDWLAAEGLANQVETVGEATTFNTLFVKTTPYVAQMIGHAPGVKEIAVTNDVHFEITQSKNGLYAPNEKKTGESSVSRRRHIVGISEIVLWTCDKEKSVHFYHDLLNLEIISPPEMPNVFLKVGEGHAGIPQMLVLVPKPEDLQAQPSGHQLHHLAFELPTDEFDNQFAALVNAGFAPRDGIHPVLSSRTMYVDDPDGNEVEFICYIDHD